MKCCYRPKDQTIPKPKNKAPIKKKIENLELDYFNGGPKIKSTFFQDVDLEANQTSLINLTQSQQAVKTPYKLEEDGRTHSVKFSKKTSSEKLHEEIKSSALVNGFTLKGRHSNQEIANDLDKRFKQIPLSQNQKSTFRKLAEKKSQIIISDSKINKKCFYFVKDLQHGSQNFLQNYGSIIFDYAEQHTEQFKKFCVIHEYDLKGADTADKQAITGHFFFSNNQNLVKELRDHLPQALTYLDSNDDLYNDFGYKFAQLAAAFAKASELL